MASTRLLGGTLPSETNERSTFNISQQIVLCLDAANLFVGLGFLMSFLQRYAYSAIGFSFLIGAFVIEWALLIKGWLLLGFDQNRSGLISINIDK